MTLTQQCIQASPSPFPYYPPICVQDDKSAALISTPPETRLSILMLQDADAPGREAGRDVSEVSSTEWPREVTRPRGFREPHDSCDARRAILLETVTEEDFSCAA